MGHDENGNKVKERRNGNGARVYGVNLDGKIAHGRDAALQVGFTVQRSEYTELEAWSENPEVAPVKRMPRTPDYYGYFTLTSAPFKNFDCSLSRCVHRPDACATFRTDRIARGIYRTIYR